MLGLLAQTDARWADAALADLDAVLRDHAHCEMKASSHALSLAARHHDDLGLVRRLTEIAREELVHFERVLDLLEARGIALGAPPIDAYAAALRTRTAKLPRAVTNTQVSALLDRLLVCALIEARSCERFKLLAARLEGLAEHAELCAFYNELLAAEARHFREFVDLARTVVSADIAIARLAELAAVEAEIVREQANFASTERASIHG